MKLLLPILLLAATLLLSACQSTAQNPRQPVQPETNTPITAKQNSGIEASYRDFSQTDYESLLGKQPFAIFFHATWCPTCKIVEDDILENINAFPEGVVILKADYDTETALKKKYNVFSQSVIVMIDSNGSASETLIAPSFSTLKNSFISLLE